MVAKQRRALAPGALGETASHHLPGLGVGLSLLCTAVLCAVDVTSDQRIVYIGSLMIGPFLASLFCRAPLTAATAVVALGAGFALGADDGIFLSHVHVAYLAVLLAGCVLATLMARYRTSQLAKLESMRRVAEIAQRAILRPLDPVVGEVRLVTSYTSAARDATVGGDFYEALDTEFGTRLLIGDVRGKGLPAVQTAALLLGAFRDSAFTDKDLAEVAHRLDAVLSRLGKPEEFATALLVQVQPGGTARLVHAGHPPALLVTSGGCRLLEPPEYGLPLGFGGVPVVHEVPYGPGDRMVLYSDGLIEARGPSGMFDLLGAAGQLCTPAEPAEALRRLMAALARHSRRLNDDVTVLIADRITGVAR